MSDIIDVLGRDSERGAYRISVAMDDGVVEALLPEELISDDLALPSTSSHQQSYEWIADHNAKILEAVRAKRIGGSVLAPFDRIAIREPD